MLQDLTAEQENALASFEALLRDRAIPLGLVAVSDADAMGERHVRDSLRASALLAPGDTLVCDIGAGAGLPALVLAIANPAIDFIAIEPKARAVGFLELAVERLGLRNVEIRAARVEDVEMAADVAMARAYGPLEKSWRAACRVLRPGGRLVYFAGERLDDPIGTARSITLPEQADSVLVERVVAGFSPLVIMTRRG